MTFHVKSISSGIMVWMDGTIIKGYNLRIHYSPTSMELMDI